MYIVISKADRYNEPGIIEHLVQGFGKVGLNPVEKRFVRITQGESAHLFVQAIRGLNQDATAALVILPQQNKEKYDAIKKYASCERGLITQVITSKLMRDERKARGAAVKIAVQIAAKLGGEPWHMHIPIKATMICGYDAYHDTSKRGRGYGAFVASMNDNFSRWWSRADQHEALDELSTKLAQDFGHSLNKYKELNGKFPERVFIYRT